MKLKGKDIHISMIYNNTGDHDKLQPAWGLSVWIEKEGGAILFDTGGDASVFKHNVLESKINLSRLQKVVISHQHWDHKNGLNYILGELKLDPELYIVEHDRKLFKEEFPGSNIIGVREPQEIEDGFWTTGELRAEYGDTELYEQSLVIIDDDSLVLITGCSHSGIVDMVAKTKKIFHGKQIRLVAGGFHLTRTSAEKVHKISSQLKTLGVKKIAPSHCTGDHAIEIFKNEWVDDFVHFDIEDELEF